MSERGEISVLEYVSLGTFSEDETCGHAFEAGGHAFGHRISRFVRSWLNGSEEERSGCRSYTRGVGSVWSGRVNIAVT